MVFEQQERESNKAFAAFKTCLELGAERTRRTRCAIWSRRSRGQLRPANLHVSMHQ
jgi:hypothetical protein